MASTRLMATSSIPRIRRPATRPPTKRARRTSSYAIPTAARFRPKSRKSHQDLSAHVKKGKLGIHTHDDCGLGVANALGVHPGGRAASPGDGQRLRRTDRQLQSRHHHREFAAQDGRAGAACGEARRVARPLALSSTKWPINGRAGARRFVGAAAFAHKGGIHVNAVNKLARSYEHIEPALVGNHQRVLVGELAGRANIMLKARTLGLKLEEKRPRGAQGSGSDQGAGKSGLRIRGGRCLVRAARAQGPGAIPAVL